MNIYLKYTIPTEYNIAEQTEYKLKFKLLLIKLQLHLEISKTNWEISTGKR